MKFWISIRIRLQTFMKLHKMTITEKENDALGLISFDSMQSFIHTYQKILMLKL